MTTPLNELRDRVLQDEALQSRLVGITDAGVFINETVRIARELGIELLHDDVEVALDTAKREWLQRWI